LFDKAIEFEERYFSDMTLKEFEKELTKYEILEDGNLIETYGDLVLDLGLEICGNNPASWWRFSIVENPDPDNKEVAGVCYGKERIIKISEQHKDDDITLLHELIHAYEVMLGQYSRFEQFLVLKLYEKLLPRIPNLMELVILDNHRDLIVQQHNPLFMLKSLDLDLRLEKTLGTVYSYERDDLLKVK
jgi:hypothetical protein